MPEYKNRPSAPLWSTRFLAWFIKEDYYEDIQGDLEEEFQQKVEGSTLGRAKYWYRWQIMRLFRPSMMKKVKPQDSIEKETIMFKNYLKIGLRNLWKYKSSTIINIVGLSTGLAAFVLIALFVQDEYSYDKHFDGVEDVYRVTVKNYTRDGDMSRHWAFASGGHAPRLKEDYSEITHAVRFFPWGFPDLIRGEEKFPGEQVIFADDDVFDIFSFKFLVGNRENALTDLYSLVLTEATAIKIFGNDWKEQDILGAQVMLASQGQEAPFKVTGVMENMPEQQHFHFEYLAPLRFLEIVMGEGPLNNVGGNYNWLTYVRMAPGADIASLEKNVNDEFWDKYIGNVRSGAPASDFYDIEFQPILDIHLKSDLEGEYETNGSIEQVYVFSTIGILLLLVACVNYMNIATSHYSRRMKEVGVRKVIGAFKSALIKQFLTESTLVTIISFPLCILLIIWALPFLNGFMGKELAFNPLTQPELSLILLALLLGVGILAGLYPALFLSKVNLVQALKGEQSMNASKWNFRSWLVTFQYGVTIALIFAIAVIESQMQFIRNSDPGYERSQVLSLSINRGMKLETFKNELLTHPKIEKASYSKRIPTGRLLDSWGNRYFSGDSSVAGGFRLPIVHVDKDFLDTYQIDLIAGENFRDGMKTMTQPDTTVAGHYIINVTAAKAYGFDDPAEAVGFRLNYGSTVGRVVGVMEDFHFESLHTSIVPMLLLYTENYRQISIKLTPDDMKSTLSFIEETYGKFETELPVNYTFVDELFNEQYQQEQRLSTMIKVFAVIAILIGCLGLIGMVGFIIETKLKEIGVRKVLGASTSSLWMLVSNRFLILVGIAFLLALPISYYFMNGWLQEFVYRTNISILIMLLPIILTVVITLLAISYQTMKATMVNPVDCLKDE